MMSIVLPEIFCLKGKPRLLLLKAVQVKKSGIGSILRQY